MRAVGIKLVHKGEWISLYEITYKDDCGNTKVYEMVSKYGTLRNPTELSLDNLGNTAIAVVMAVFNKDMSRILLSKEFRMGVNQYVYNFPAGLREPGESIQESASRELMEETGLHVIDVLRHLKSTFTCAPVTDDVTDFIVLRADGEIRDSQDINEEIHPAWYSKEEVIKLINSNETMFAGRTQAFCYMWASSNMTADDF